MNHNDPFLSIDRAHERQEEADDAFDATLAAETKRQAAAMRHNVLTGHWQTLEGLAESLAHRLSQRGNSEMLIRSVLSCGPLTGGQQLLLLIDSCIEEDAETAALVEMERGRKSGGLDVAAMRAAAAQEVLVMA